MQSYVINILHNYHCVINNWEMLLQDFQLVCVIVTTIVITSTTIITDINTYITTITTTTTTTTTTTAITTAITTTTTTTTTESLGGLPALESVNLKNNNLTDKSLGKLISILPNCRHLKELDLSNNKIDIKAAFALGDYLRSPLSSSLERLVLQQADVDDVECCHWAEDIAVNNTVKYLDLTNNMIGKCNTTTMTTTTTTITATTTTTATTTSTIYSHIYTHYTIIIQQDHMNQDHSIHQKKQELQHQHYYYQQKNALYKHLNYHGI